jgi:hypothetical protein
VLGPRRTASRRGPTRLAAALVALALGCGARSDLSLAAPDAGADALRPECARDEHCDDGVACTADRCEGRRCVHAPRDARCDDGRFCTGVGRCDPTDGCLFAGNPCGDGVACTEDRCDEALDRCEAVPRVDRCPLSHRCDPALGCVARALVHTPEELLEVDLPGGAVRVLAPAEVPLTDIALHPDGRTFGISASSLFAIDEADGSARWLAALEAQHVALDVHPDGALVAAGERTVSRIDPDTGVADPFARFPGRFSASGDIAFVRGRMLVTGTDTPARPSGSDDRLFEVPAAGGTLVELGSVGFACVWALAPFGETLYGFTCNGQLLEIDPETGAGRLLRELGDYFFGGAAAR